MRKSEYMRNPDAETAITLLMSRGKLNWGWRLEPEQRESIELADILRKATSNGSLKAVWSHVANEGKRSQIVGAILKAMGLIPGAPDFWFIWEKGGGVIELKIKPNKLSDNQNYFFKWCDHNNVPRAVCYSKEAALEVLEGWGIYQPGVRSTQLRPGFAEGITPPLTALPSVKHGVQEEAGLT